MLISRVKISFFRVITHLVFHKFLYHFLKILDFMKILVAVLSVYFNASYSSEDPCEFHVQANSG